MLLRWWTVRLKFRCYKTILCIVFFCALRHIIASRGRLRVAPCVEILLLHSLRSRAGQSRGGRSGRGGGRVGFRVRFARVRGALPEPARSGASTRKSMAMAERVADELGIESSVGSPGVALASACCKASSPPVGHFLMIAPCPATLPSPRPSRAPAWAAGCNTAPGPARTSASSHPMLSHGRAAA